ncbi:protein PIN-LIKES 3 isoform X3 [Quercus suber]|uniref:protein PIN-LIKES 3 isoform X3 n=1 Tax=Quercus suber TaxID=58331 RepID=UPI000CE1ACC8|nr:protein PIN-LIKES 3-like isoform X3 [Quercus suber]
MALFFLDFTVPYTPGEKLHLSLVKKFAMEFLDLFIVALMPVLKILLVTAVGLFLATERINLLGADARPYLNNLVFYLFSPSIIFSNLAETITLDSLTNLWFMPVNILLTFIIGSALAWILVKITRAPRHLRSLIIGSCAAGNLGNFLLIIIPALCDDDNSPFGDSSVCSTDGESYVALSMAIGAVYIWSYVYAIMRLSANKATKEIDASGSTIQDSASGEIAYSEICPEALLPSRGSPISQEDTDQAEVPSTKSEGKAKIIGFIVGIISPIRKVLVGDDAPLRAIYNSVSLISDATIPCMTLIIGANLLKGLKTSGVGPLIILGIIAIRFIILPSLGIVIVKAANHFGMVGSDSLYQFTLMLQYSLPPAMNVGTISQLLKTGESECSVIMLWTYAVASLFLTLWSTIFMWIVA